jgi:hypothetical protein
MVRKKATIFNYDGDFKIGDLVKFKKDKDMSKARFSVGNIVKWIDSPYEIVYIKGNKVSLKQKFSIGVTIALVNMDELIKVD